MSEGFRLVMTRGPEPGRTFTLETEMVMIGRDPASEVVINHPQVSRQHARLTRQGSVMVLEDLGSTNGTFINGIRLTAPHVLNNEDVIGLGDAVAFTFYGPAGSLEETVLSRPGTVVAPQTPPPPPARRPAYTPPPPPTPTPVYGPPPAPAPVYGPPPAVEEPPKKKRTGLYIGCGCLVLLVIAACVGLFLLDYFGLLPPVFYEPLRWLGIF
jgi:hypothetical protein